MEIRLFESDDLPAVLRLCAAEGWPSFPADPARALRVLTAPGVTTVVAVDDDNDGRVVGFAELFSDGELQAYLANLVVDAERRGAGVGRRLVTEALRVAGGERVDLLSDLGATGFYDTFPHFERPGFRLYPLHPCNGD